MVSLTLIRRNRSTEGASLDILKHKNAFSTDKASCRHSPVKPGRRILICEKRLEAAILYGNYMRGIVSSEMSAPIVEPGNGVKKEKGNG